MIQLSSESINMFRLLIACTLIAIALAAPQRGANVPMLDGRIVGGNAVNIEDHPYQVSVLYYGSHICGGSIISNRYVVTAAHCTAGSSASLLSVRVGSSIRNSGGTVVGVQVIHQNPSYNSATIDHDISVLQLDADLMLGVGVAAVGLPVQDQAIVSGATSVVSGWGTLSEGGNLPSQLQAVKVPVVSNKECGAAYGSSSITDRMMCAGIPEGGKDACQGDSGGPLVIDGQLIGIVSWGYGCARPGFPGVYTSVPAFRSYITSTSGI